MMHANAHPPSTFLGMWLACKLRQRCICGGARAAHVAHSGYFWGAAAAAMSEYHDK